MSNNVLGSLSKNNSADVKFYSNVALAYLKEIKDIPVLSQEEEKSLAIKSKNGDNDAYHKLVKHNLRLVVSIAKRYINQNVELMDMIEDGNIGLMKAVENFDYTKGYKLSTYATPWIKHYIKIGTSKMYSDYKIPVGVYSKIMQAKVNLSQQEAAQDNSNDLINEDYEEYREILERKFISMQSTIIGKKSGVCFEPFVKDENSEYEDSVINSIDAKQIIKMIFVDNVLNLSEKKLKILKYRFGVETGVMMRQEDVAQICGVSHQLVSEIERNFKQRINRNCMIKNLYYN